MVDFVEASPLRTYNFSKMIFDGLVKNVNNKGEGSGTPTEPHHTPSSEAQPPSHTTHSSSILPPITTTSIPTVTPSETTPIRQYTRRARIDQSSTLLTVADEPDKATIAKSSTLPHDSAPRVTSPVADEGREAAAERASDDTEEMAIVLTSMDAATVLASGAAEVSTGSGSIPIAGPPAAEVPTGSDVVPTASLVFATATVVTPYKRSKGKEVMEYHQFASELPIKRRIELISDRVKYQDNYAKVYKFQSQQIKPWTKKQKRDYYMAVIRSNLSWKVKDFRGMTFEEVKAKFNSEGAKKQKTSEEFTEEAKSPDEVPKEKKVDTEGQRSYCKITRLGGSSASYQFFIDLLKHLDRDDLNQLWRLVKEALSNRPPTNDKEMEL
nr:hypothetical protein [Tanacetum cinerariifolium]